MNPQLANLVGKIGFSKKTSLDNKGMHTAPGACVDTYVRICMCLARKGCIEVLSISKEPINRRLTKCMKCVYDIFFYISSRKVYKILYNI